MKHHSNNQAASTKTRKLFLFTWLIVIFSVICFMFWQNEIVYSLPTPVPEKYKAVQIGSHINIGSEINFDNCNPVFIHFFNPDCPCSRFNIPHFKSLVKRYGDKINFAIVVLNKDKIFSAGEIQKTFDMMLPIFFKQSIAIACGVYSTPQAVIIDGNHNLYYRGNYNKSRYCSDTQSDFAQMAIDSLLQNNSDPVFSSLALKAYGCSLPNCKK